MPMHDWTRVTPNDYHHFHLMWIAQLAGALNRGLLPPGYFAMAEHSITTAIPDVLTMSLGDRGNGPPPSSSAGGVATAPRASVTATAEGQPYLPPASSRKRIGIREAAGRKLVAVIEIVSPSKRATKAGVKDFQQKMLELLENGIHAQVIDPFPPNGAAPAGLHAAVWRKLTRKRYAPPAGKPLTLVAYVARGGNVFTTYVEPLAVGDPLPDLPLFLTPHVHIPVSLEPTYAAAWESFPAVLRTPLEG